jgi:hypothetical protein
MQFQWSHINKHNIAVSPFNLFLSLVFKSTGPKETLNGGSTVISFDVLGKTKILNCWMEETEEHAVLSTINWVFISTKNTHLQKFR